MIAQPCPEVVRGNSQLYLREPCLLHGENIGHGGHGRRSIDAQGRLSVGQGGEGGRGVARGRCEDSSVGRWGDLV